MSLPIRSAAATWLTATSSNSLNLYSISSNTICDTCPMDSTWTTTPQSSSSCTANIANPSTNAAHASYKNSPQFFGLSSHFVMGLTSFGLGGA